MSLQQIVGNCGSVTLQQPWQTAIRSHLRTWRRMPFTRHMWRRTSLLSAPPPHVCIFQLQTRICGPEANSEWLGLADLSQMINFKPFSPYFPCDARVVPLYTSVGRNVDSLLRQVENDSMGLLRPNSRETVFSLWPLGNHLKKPYIWMFLICKFLFKVSF